MDFMTNKKSPNFGLFSSILKYRKKQRLKEKIYSDFEDAVDNNDYRRIQIISKRYLNIK